MQLRNPTGAVSLLALTALASACIERDVEPSQPIVTNITLERVPSQAVKRIDLLFMIDNSMSMADKQEMLGDAVPMLVNRLIDPVCVVPDSDTVVRNSSAEGCPSGSQPQFRPVEDIHIGVITSSLGGHGGSVCTPAYGPTYWNETQNDRGRLIARDATGAPVGTWEEQGFLAWDPAGEKRPPGEADPVQLVDRFRDLVLGAGEQGCGFEASLEAWYRFLIDPEPPLDIVESADGQSEAVGIDEVLLQQRAEFLRPDSLVAIIMLTDENDCSIQDSGYGLMVSGQSEGAMPRSTSQCDTNPNDPCCLSCIQAAWPTECGNPQQDPKCQEALLHPVAEDPLNLRCFDQKRRFGLDFLYPVQRYVDALAQREVPRRSGGTAPNPLYAPSAVYPELLPRTDDDLVYLAGIVGVPWQDIATDESLDGDGLEYLDALELAERGIWDDILGNPAASPPAAPRDPFMIESVAPRTGLNPRTRIATDPPAPGAGGNAINGHEYDVQGNADLQYACIFPLGTDRDCSVAAPNSGCDCDNEDEAATRPLCNGSTQTYAKAYPGTRILEVLRGVGTNSVVASICPKRATGDRSDPSYGYNPAVKAIIDRLVLKLKGACLSRPLAMGDDGHVLCKVVEVTRAEDAAPCRADLPGRMPVEDSVAEVIRDELREMEVCGPQGPACDSYSLCQLRPAADDEYASCLNDDDGSVAATGYCYIDATRVDAEGNPDPVGNPELVERCKEYERRLLRFVSPPQTDVPLPWPNSWVLALCQGEVFPTN